MILIWPRTGKKGGEEIKGDKNDGDTVEIEGDKNDQDTEGVRGEKIDQDTEELQVQMANGEPMDEDESDLEDTEIGEDKETHTIIPEAKELSADERTKVQSSNGIAKSIKVKTYEQNLSGLSTRLLSQKQIAKLELASKGGPNFLGRTASQVRGVKFGQFHKKTNGYTTQDVLLPAADSRGTNYCSHARLENMTKGEIRYMIGNHLIWKDLVGDELLSYSKDPLFLVVHALRRHHEEQGTVTIQFLDRRKAKTPDGEPAKFYSALDLYTIFRVPGWSGWGSTDIIKLHPRKFTQEYLSHGPVLHPGTNLKQASIEDLIKDGLYEIFPEFDTPEEHKRAGLYTLQVVYRKIGYPPATAVDAMKQQGPSRAPKTKKVTDPIYSYENCSRLVSMTEELLIIVRKVTMNFRVVPENVDATTLEPPLHAFICFLTFHKRQKEDPIFVQWIKKHYDGMSLNFLIYFTAPMLT